MNKSTTIQTRVDPKLKSEAISIFGKLNLTMSDAISLFLRQVILRNGLPFEVRVPNEITQETLNKTELGKELHSVENADQLFKELNS